MNYPKYVEVNGRTFTINTDFRYALQCDRIAKDSTINDYERSLAIIYTLFGEEGLNSQECYEKLLEMAKKYLTCGKELEDTNEDADMDYDQDMDYIEASFMSDFHIDLANVEMHWWKFNKLINGLSNSELGNCCVLNRVRNLRNYDMKDIKDSKEREKIRKAKESVALHKTPKKEATQEQQESALRLYEALGFDIGKE